MQDIVQKATPMAKKLFSQLENIFQIGLTDEDQIQKFDDCLNKLYDLERDEFFKSEFKKLESVYTCLGTCRTIQGRSRVKPFGYSGDFKIIDYIYTHHVSDDPYCALWDNYFHKQNAPIAVRNRKKYFIELLIKNIDISKKQKVLNLASGPGRDILEYFECSNNNQIHFDCVELDKDAIQFAKNLLSDHIDRVKFINKNIFRFTPTEEYDMIWSAGLFDYFDDSVFVKILSRLISSNPNTKIVIGNFSDANPTQPYMEIIGDWFLNYRSEEKLIELALKAGANRDSITVECEPEKVNLFLHIN